MAMKFFAFYQLTDYAAAPYPVLTVISEDDLDFVPDDIFVSEGWTVGVTHDYAIFGEWDDDDGETSFNEWWITPGTTRETASASKTPTNTQALPQRQASQQSVLTSLIRSNEWTQFPSSTLTIINRGEFKQWLEELAGIPDPSSPYYQTIWATDPESIVIPARPTEAHDTTDLAFRAADLMGDNTISVAKVAVADRDNLVPEFSFDDADPDLFIISSSSSPALVNSTTGTYAYFTTNGISGGHCLIYVKNTIAGGAAADVTGKPANFAGIKGGRVYTWEWDYQLWAGTPIANGLQLVVRWYDAAKALLSTAAVSGVTPTTTWTFQNGQVTAPSTARYVTFTIRMLEDNPQDMAVKVDNVTLRRTLLSDDLMAGSIDGSKLATNSVNGSKIIQNSITSSELAPLAVFNGHLNDGIVNNAKLADSAVGTTKLANLSVTSAKIATNAVTGSELASGAVSTTHIVADAVTYRSGAERDASTVLIPTISSSLGHYVIGGNIDRAAGYITYIWAYAEVWSPATAASTDRCLLIFEITRELSGQAEGSRVSCYDYRLTSSLAQHHPFTMMYVDTSTTADPNTTYRLRVYRHANHSGDWRISNASFVVTQVKK